MIKVHMPVGLSSTNLLTGFLIAIDPFMTLPRPSHSEQRRLYGIDPLAVVNRRRMRILSL